MQHLDEGTIHAWLDGALAPLEAEQVAKHASECATCGAAVAEARGIIAGSARIVSALDDVPGGVIPGRTKGGGASGSSAWRRLRLTPGRAALAATVLLAVGTTLTLRSASSPQSSPDTAIAVVQKAAPPAAAPAPAPTLARGATMDSIKIPGASGASVVNASAPKKANIVVTVPAQNQPVAERREVADAAARDTTTRDTTTRALAKARVAAQDAAAGANAAPTAPAPAMATTATAARRVVTPGNALEHRADSVSTFEGCYRLSADSSSGSTEMLRGLPARFTLARPSTQARVAEGGRLAFSTQADSSSPLLAWRQLPGGQASVTFAGSTAGGRVSLLLTAGSPVGMASSGDRTAKVRVVRASCTP